MYVGSGRSETVVNGNYNFVDAVKSGTGATCTIFMKQDDKAQRISTNVVNQDGTRAVGTFVSQPVYDAVIAGSKPYQGRAWVVNDWYVAAYDPIYDTQHRVVGILYVGVPERSPSLRAAMLSQKVGKTGYLYAMDSKGVLQVHPAKEKADLSKYDFIKEMMERAPKLADGEIAWITYPWINKELGETTARDKIVAFTYFKDWDWIIASGSYLDEFTAPTVALRNSNLLIGLLALILAMVICYLFARSLTRPMSSLTEAANALAQGETDIRVNVHSNDELGALAKAFTAIVEYQQTTAHQARRIADGDLTVNVELRSDKDEVGNSFQTMVKSLSDMVRELGENERGLVSASTEIASSAELMSKGARTQADQVVQVSAAIEEMTANIVESSKNATDATEAAKGAASTATSGGQVVHGSIKAMQQIADTVRKAADAIVKLASSADQIGEIINVIDDIADQTNLLALNAAIEAARAGEQGRGFAVVADEVRKLAERTGKATGEITQTIKGIQRETEEAVDSMEAGIQVVDKGRELVDKAGSSLNEIVTMAQRVTEMIQQMATSAQEQSGASEQISKNIEHISGITKETATGAEQSSAAAEELSRQAESLRVMVEKYKIDGADLQILTLAKNDHRQYMKRLKAVFDGETDPKTWKHADHHACRLGKWYDTTGRLMYTSNPEFQAIEPPHERVHKFGNECIRMLFKGDKGAASKNYDLALAASHEVAERLSEMERAYSGSTKDSVAVH